METALALAIFSGIGLLISLLVNLGQWRHSRQLAEINSGLEYEVHRLKSGLDQRLQRLQRTRDLLSLLHREASRGVKRAGWRPDLQKGKLDVREEREKIIDEWDNWDVYLVELLGISRASKETRLIQEVEQLQGRIFSIPDVDPDTFTNLYSALQVDIINLHQTISELLEETANGNAK